ncbi:DUF4961 domain-containing protein [Pontibacter oryzae]|uniref:T9SS C-terminal target domain-containing protein n=1 Tax=Pontibacter oryzae TaxID=2304593 RepID=A0A399SKF6_9BACT|nr:alpha-amylase family glycosyl hydrolase [Pontibacter oryzae]RIJ42407.1 T9SS C-terminal target domain-containing protein [Pontibacter oryzae]
MKIFTLARYFLVVLWLLAVPALGQVVTTDPAFPTADKPVTLIFDVSKATHSKASGLLGKTSDVYLWSGAGSTATGDAFEYQPAGQTNFNAPFEPGKMTSMGKNKWQITIVPRTYFGVPTGTAIRKLGLLLKSGNGSAQTEDLFVEVYPDELRVSFRQPVQEFFFAEANGSIEISAEASEDAALRLTHDGVELKKVANGKSLSYTLAVGAVRGSRHEVVIEAKTASATVTDAFAYTIEPEPTIAALPAGVKDGINYVSATEAILVLYAPHKNNAYVIGEFNNWQPTQPYLMHKTPDAERYWLRLANLPAGQEVAFQYLVDGTIAIADPYTEKILDPNNDKYLTSANYPNLKPYPEGATGIVSLLQTQQQPYNWQVKNFERPNVNKLVVYELLVRDFVKTQNYQTLTDTLSYFKRLGINAIELMPIMEFSGNDSWGYNPIFYFAPDKAYGTKQDLKRFIDAAHEAGIAIILDIVLNQADYEFPYVKLYWDKDKPAADNPYFNQNATHPFNVFFDFNHESPATKAFVQRVTNFWLEEYNVDGFRFDLSKGFTQKVTGGDVGAWSAYDAGRVATWKRIYNEIRSTDESAYIILEHFGDNAEEKELANYGMLFWGNANYDFRQLGKGDNANPQWMSYKVRGWQKPHVVGFLESHDEERFMYDVRQYGRSAGSYNAASQGTALNRAKLAAAFGLAIPGPKMIWQFGELGYDISIDQNGRTGKKPILWQYQQDPDRAKLYQVYAELIRLKTTQPVFATNDFNLDLDKVVKRVTLANTDMMVFLIGNFDIKSQSPSANFPGAGMWYDYFSGQELKVDNPNETIVLQPGEFRLFTSQKLEGPKASLVPWAQVVLSADEKLVKSEGLKLYPNPSPGKSVLNIENSFRGLLSVQLKDVMGRTVQTYSLLKTQEMAQQELKIDALPDGLYFVQVSDGNKRMVLKLVKLGE